MTNIYPIEHNKKIREEASLWIIKIDKNEYDDTELIMWMHRSPQHVETLFEMAKTWDNSDILSNLSEIFPLAKSSNRSTNYRYAIAASIMLFFSALFFIGKPKQEETNADIGQTAQNEIINSYKETYETIIGGHSTVNLPDGSKITLNTNTRIEVNYTEEIRSIELLKGEAHFEVAHEPERPLTVSAAGKLIQAVGTAFNIELINHAKAKVLVTEGEVIIKNKSLPVQIDSMHYEDVIPLTRGEMIIVGDNNESETEPVDLDELELEQALSWIDGNLIFQGEPLAVAIEEISRYTNIKIRIADEKLKDIKLAGLFRAGDIDGLLFALEESFNIPHRRIGHESIILGKE